MGSGGGAPSSEPLAGSKSRAPAQGIRGKAPPWSWKHFVFQKCANEVQLCPFLANRTISRAFGTLCRLSSVVCNVLYCGKTVHPSKKLSEGVNRKPGSKSWFFGSPPYFYFRFRRYGHRDGRFCLIFASTAKQSVLEGTNWLYSSKPCAYYRVVWSELKPEVVLAMIVDLERCK